MVVATGAWPSTRGIDAGAANAGTLGRATGFGVILLLTVVTGAVGTDVEAGFGAFLYIVRQLAISVSQVKSVSKNSFHNSMVKLH